MNKELVSLLFLLNGMPILVYAMYKYFIYPQFVSMGISNVKNPKLKYLIVMMTLSTIASVSILIDYFRQ